MSQKNILLNQKQAEQIAHSLFNQLQSPDYLIKYPLEGNYNYSIQIESINSTAIVYIYYGKEGNKIVLQGNQNSQLYKEISQKLNQNPTYSQFESKGKDHKDEPENYIGVDESGKGDFFGPLIIAGFYVNGGIITELKKLQIKDSKLLSDDRIIQFANTLIDNFKDYISIVQIFPKKYNELYKKIGNLNSLLAWGHARCIENILIKHKVSLAICDQFGNENYIKNALMKNGKQIELIQTPKAERFIGVAAASILARNSFIGWIRRTEEKIGVKIPKGANQKVKEAAKLIENKFGKEALSEYVKVHFKTFNEI